MTIEETTLYKVDCFMDRDAKQHQSSRNCTIMMASGIKGKMKGYPIPFGMNIARKLKLKVGDTFSQTIYTSRDLT